MKKFARTTTYLIIRGSQPKAERFSIRVGHSVYLRQILDRWLIRFRKHVPMRGDSNKGGARPIGREDQKYS